jgi:hypothetical protein
LFCCAGNGGVINKSSAALATLKMKNLTSAGYSNNCKPIAKHCIMRLNLGLRTVDVKNLMAGSGIEKALKTP